jgi:amino acid permease
MALKENCVRVGCVVFFFSLAYAVPNINDLATLVGGLMSPLLGFIFPPIFNLKLFRGRLPWYIIGVNWFLIIFGAFAGIYTTIQQVQKMAK